MCLSNKPGSFNRVYSSRTTYAAVEGVHPSHWLSMLMCAGAIPSFFFLSPCVLLVYSSYLGSLATQNE